MITVGILHEAKSHQAYAISDTTVQLSLRTVKDDVDQVHVIWGDPFNWEEVGKDKEWTWCAEGSFLPQMHKTYSDGTFDYWEIKLSPPYKRMRYSFILRSKADGKDIEVIYGAHGFFDLKLAPKKRTAISDYFNFPYIHYEDLFKAPAWVKDAIWYQIFPERFSNGNPELNAEGTLPWGSEHLVKNEMLFGGDLQGVLDRLPYLSELGVTAIYFTPIFHATSTHKYDTIDYYTIDPSFGTNDLFKLLVQEAHRLDIKVMLDAVFNHCGFKHPFFQDVVEKGRDSSYYDWFHILRDPVINFPMINGYPQRGPHLKAGSLNYETFAFTPMMPKWRTGHPECEAYLLDIGRYWVEEFDIDGWRLDVSNEVSHDFWRKFRQEIKRVKPDCFILGENWDDARPWLLGDQFDGVMNYEWTVPVWRLLADEEHTGYPAGTYTASHFKNDLSRLMATVPKNIFQSMFNLIDSHDTSRILTQCGGSIPKVKLAFVLQMVFAGSPSIYYGSEQGLTGVGDGNRQCMVWDESRQNIVLYEHVKRLIAIRHNEGLTKEVDLLFLPFGDEKAIVFFEKKIDSRRLVVCLNVTDVEQTMEIPAAYQGQYNDLYHGQFELIMNNLSLEPYGFKILVQNIA